ncbi:GIY-YIG nuclease family protein [Brevundimonas sp.]|uniref:GIY-YIG nuclease family protein n=1 Tax=Brevundimonas sp. TaxID=1871086 RepID=UPI00351150C7
MYYVYLLESLSAPRHRYVGVTEDLKVRLTVHNSGGSPHTAGNRPWRVVTYVAFSDKVRLSPSSAT